MTEQERNEKIKQLMEAWKEEIDKIPPNPQPQHGARLDGRKNEEYSRISDKYIKLINEVKNT